jgi:hypothetical protein
MESPEQRGLTKRNLAPCSSASRRTNGERTGGASTRLCTHGHGVDVPSPCVPRQRRSRGGHLAMADDPLIVLIAPRNSGRVGSMRNHSCPSVARPAQYAHEPSRSVTRGPTASRCGWAVHTYSMRADSKAFVCRMVTGFCTFASRRKLHAASSAVAWQRARRTSVGGEDQTLFGTSDVRRRRPSSVTPSIRSQVCSPVKPAGQNAHSPSWRVTGLMSSLRPRWCAMFRHTYRISAPATFPTSIAASAAAY